MGEEEQRVLNLMKPAEVVCLTRDTLSENGAFLRGITANNDNIFVADRNKNAIHALTYKDNTMVSHKRFKGELSTPDCVVKDVLTNHYVVSDSYNHRILQFYADNGKFEVISGDMREARQLDGSLAEARFYYPKGIAVDKDGIIYVTESSHTIRKIDRRNNLVSTIAGTLRGYRDGNCAEAQFDWPCAVEIDSLGNLYIADKNNSCVRFLDAKTGIVSTLVGNQKGLVDGPFETAKFKEVFDLKLDSEERNLWLCDSGNKKIRKLDLKKRQVNTLELSMEFQLPRGLVFDSRSSLLITDASTNAVYRIVLKRPLPWKVARLLWIGQMKEQTSTCNLTKLPRELIFVIIHIANDLPEAT